MSIKGFTLIEVIVVLGILVVIVSIGTGLLTNVIQGSNKAQVLNLTRQNAHAAFAAIERDVRMATGLPLFEACVSCARKFLTLVQPDGQTAIRYEMCRWLASNPPTNAADCSDSCPSGSEDDARCTIGHIRRYTCTEMDAAGRQFVETGCTDDGPVTNTRRDRGVELDVGMSQFAIKTSGTTVIEPTLVFQMPRDAKVGQGGALSGDQTFRSTFVVRN